MEFLQKILEKSASNAETICISALLLALAWIYIFKKKRAFLGALLLAASVISFGYLGGLLSWLSGLGGDSFLETRHFDLNEAFFWTKTFFSSVQQMLITFNKTALLIGAEILLLSAILLFILRKNNRSHHILIAPLALGVLYTSHQAHAGFQMGRDYVKELETQFSESPSGFSSKENIDLFVYIGESTSSLNMSLYGYPTPTTPKLDQLGKEDAGFIRFEKVRSTHTHTSPSLMRALALTTTQTEGTVQWGIGQVLKQAGVEAELHSVQPLNGSFATFSRFVFEGVRFDLPREDRYKANYAAPRQKDHELLDKIKSQSGVIFFHSYAGHGGYLDHIETELSHKPDLPKIRFDGMFGASFSERINSDLTQQVSDYNQAITYVDRNVSLAIESIKARKKPAVLFYFSDHGDAVYAKRGHESSNYIDEMTTVPVVLYFNQAYQDKYPQTFLKYRKAAHHKHTKLLDQVSPTILDILQIKSENKLDVPTLAETFKHPRPFIVERGTLSGASRIDLTYNNENGFSNSAFFGGTPEPTYTAILTERFGDENTICYHRSNSYAKALRAASVANCIEFDLMVDGDALNVYHPPSTATGLQIQHIFKIAEAQKNSLWIDGKNLDDPIACARLTSYLEQNYTRVGKIFVEFPSGAIEKKEQLTACADRLKKIGARRSYYVPTHYAVPCAQDSKKNFSACKELNQAVQLAMASGMYSDLSFDYLGYPAMKQVQGADKLKWNTWAIKAQDFNRIPRKEFDFVIMDTSTDPNTY